MDRRFVFSEQSRGPDIDGLLAALPSERLISFGEREAARATAYRFDAA
jgi:hypothetical protein